MLQDDVANRIGNVILQHNAVGQNHSVFGQNQYVFSNTPSTLIMQHVTVSNPIGKGILQHMS